MTRCPGYLLQSCSPLMSNRRRVLVWMVSDVVTLLLSLLILLAILWANICCGPGSELIHDRVNSMVFWAQRGCHPALPSPVVVEQKEQGVCSQTERGLDSVPAISSLDLSKLQKPSMTQYPIYQMGHCTSPIFQNAVRTNCSE